jgi:di/tripeptidase
MKETALERFLRYAKIDTQSAEDSKTYPSTENQRDLLKLLETEMNGLGLKDVTMDEHGYVTGTLPGNLAPKQARFKDDRVRRSFSQSLAIFPALIVAH